MKKLPPKERPAWCCLYPLSWDELLVSTDIPLWLEIKGFEHLNQWCLLHINDVTQKVTLLTAKGIWDVQEKYGEDFMAYSPLPPQREPAETAELLKNIELNMEKASTYRQTVLPQGIQ